VPGPPPVPLAGDRSSARVYPAHRSKLANFGRGPMVMITSCVPGRARLAVIFADKGVDDRSVPEVSACISRFSASRRYSHFPTTVVICLLHRCAAC
jgi:hypothetical protein